MEKIKARKEGRQLQWHSDHSPHPEVGMRLCPSAGGGNFGQLPAANLLFLGFLVWHQQHESDSGGRCRRRWQLRIKESCVTAGALAALPYRCPSRPERSQRCLIAACL